MTVADISLKTNDFDSLGDRLSRARDAKNSSVAEVAKLAGVELKTVKSWESDRTAPRSNRLTMLAGILGVSPTWLLFGRGTSPIQNPTSGDGISIKRYLHHLRAQRQVISAEIDRTEKSLRQTTSKSSH